MRKFGGFTLLNLLGMEIFIYFSFFNCTSTFLSVKDNLECDYSFLEEVTFFFLDSMSINSFWIYVIHLTLSHCRMCAGNKVNNIDVVYTPWQNLKKTASMDVGQVGFHNSKMVRCRLVLKCLFMLACMGYFAF